MKKSNQAWADLHFGVLAKDELASDASLTTRSNKKDAPIAYSLAKDVDIENGWLKTDDWVDVRKDGSLLISSRLSSTKKQEEPQGCGQQKNQEFDFAALIALANKNPKVSGVAIETARGTIRLGNQVEQLDETDIWALENQSHSMKP